MAGGERKPETGGTTFESNLCQGHFLLERRPQGVGGFSLLIDILQLYLCST